MFQRIMKNESIVEEENRYYNWYYGFSSMSLPYFYKDADAPEEVLRYEMKTNAITGKNNQKNKVIPRNDVSICYLI